MTALPKFFCDSCNRRRSFTADIVDGEIVEVDPRETAKPTPWTVRHDSSWSAYRQSDFVAFRRVCECGYMADCPHLHRTEPPAEKCAATLNRKMGL